MSVINRNLRVFKVFISSPSDVADARQRVRKAIEHINRIVAKPNGILFEALGWEDIPTGKAKRSQKLINKYLESVDIYIGILNKRFGTPTGKAESGTEEEYNHICSRWQSEESPPEVKMYFKRLKEKDLIDPGPQLKKVLEFKNRIESTDFYHVFDSEDKLEERIEEELADLVYSKLARHTDNASPEKRADLDFDVRILSKLIEFSSVKLHDLVEEFGLGATVAVEKMQKRDLLRVSHEILSPSNATEGFLAVAKLMFNSEQQRKLLQSDYYQGMLKRVLEDIVQSRFHCHLNKDQVKVFRKLATLSPAAAEYILFGDTELYDNLAEDARKKKQESFAQEFLLSNFIHRVLLRYGEDSCHGNILDTVEGVAIEAYVYTVRLNAAHANGRAFSVESVFPSVRFLTTEDVKKGQLLSGELGNLVYNSVLMIHMEEYEVALKQLDTVLSHQNVPAEVRAAALNNKGLVFIAQGKHKEAVPLLEEALQLAPDLEEARANIEQVRRAIESADGSNV